MGMMMHGFQGEWSIWQWVMLVAIAARVAATLIGILTGIRKGPLTRPGFIRLALPALIAALGLPWLAMLFQSMSYIILLQVLLPLLQYLIVHAAARRLIALRLSPQLCWVSLIPYATVVIVIVLSFLQTQAKTPEQKTDGSKTTGSGPVQR